MTLCECGCGQQTNIYRGKSRRYIHGHNPIKKILPPVHVCRVCSDELDDDNWYPSRRVKSDYICKTCNVEDVNRRRVQRPMSENRDCPAFLGVHVAEGVLCEMFKDVIRMPHNNPWYDFICNNGYLMDSKASCKCVNNNKTPRWTFRIGKNIIADYFILMAFDNRDNLTPLHIWMMPGHIINNQTSVSISETTIHKWDEYRLDIDKVITCCNAMREGEGF